MVSVVIFLILIPLTVIIFSLIDDMASLVDFLRNFNTSSLSFLDPEVVPLVENYFVKVSESLTSSLLNLLVRFGGSIPDKIINVLVFVFATSLFLRKGPEIIKKFKVTLPIEKKQKETLIKEFENVTQGILYSLFFSAIYNGVVGGMIFYVLGIPNSLLWGFMMGVFSIIPIIGSIPVWVGGIIYMLLLGNYLLALILIVLMGVVSNLDGLIITKVCGEKSKINSFLIFIGIVSGIRLFGPSGLIFGPLILSLLITIIRFYTKDYKMKFEF